VSKTVVLVDDAALVRLVLTRLLQQGDLYEVVAACENGQRALEVIAAADPDLLLVDIEMPVMDGLAFLRRARIKTRARIVVLSAAAELGSPAAREARRLGADAILEKPSGSASPDLQNPSGERILSALARIAA
jgi:two-component system, chemotaxis family, protein-glutamate methylesterase/glutaminase